MHTKNFILLSFDYYLNFDLKQTIKSLFLKINYSVEKEIKWI